MLIYKVTNITNNKVYIGKTAKSLDIRKKWHKYHYLTGKSYFHKALRCYGFDNFLWEIIDIVTTSKDLNNKEKFYIRFYKSNNPEIGYNLSEGGDGGDTFTNDINKEMRRAKMRENTLGHKNPFYGKTHTEETKKLIGANTTKHRAGAKHTEETKAKMKLKALGENNSQAKLTAMQVAAIKKLLKTKQLSQAKIADLYKVSRSTILKIHLGTMWR